VSATAVDRSMRGVKRPKPPLKSNPDGTSQPPGVAAKQRCRRQPRERAVDESRNRANYCVNGRGVERRSGVPQCRSMETVVIDKFGGSINGNDGWQLVRTIKQRGKLSTVSDSKLRGSFDHRQARLCRVSHVQYRKSKSENRKLYRVPKSTIRFLPIFAKIDPIRFPIQISFVL
jgi:hypothetical protein